MNQPGTIVSNLVRRSQLLAHLLEAQQSIHIQNQRVKYRPMEEEAWTWRGKAIEDEEEKVVLVVKLGFVEREINEMERLEERLERQKSEDRDILASKSPTILAVAGVAVEVDTMQAMVPITDIRDWLLLIIKLFSRLEEAGCGLWGRIPHQIISTTQSQSYIWNRCFSGKGEDKYFGTLVSSQDKFKKLLLNLLRIMLYLI